MGRRAQRRRGTDWSRSRRISASFGCAIRGRAEAPTDATKTVATQRLTSSNHLRSTLMNLKSLITRFASDEDGAVTVDWVVLTGGLVGLAAIIGSYVANGVDTAGGNIQTQLEAPTTFAVTSGGGATTTP
jgi:hypothetical protein